MFSKVAGIQSVTYFMLTKRILKKERTAILQNTFHSRKYNLTYCDATKGRQYIHRDGIIVSKTSKNLIFNDLFWS